MPRLLCLSDHVYGEGDDAQRFESNTVYDVDDALAGRLLQDFGPQEGSRAVKGGQVVKFRLYIDPPATPEPAEEKFELPARYARDGGGTPERFRERSKDPDFVESEGAKWRREQGPADEEEVE